jgi:hypothetical protein
MKELQQKQFQSWTKDRTHRFSQFHVCTYLLWLREVITMLHVGSDMGTWKVHEKLPKSRNNFPKHDTAIGRYLFPRQANLNC